MTRRGHYSRVAGLELTIRDLDVGDYAIARRLVGIAFAGEPFAVGMFGESLLDRFVGMAGEYADWPHLERPLAVAADAGDVLVGAAVSTFPGECELCRRVPEPPAGPMSLAAEVEWEFQLRCRDVHLRADLPRHAHLCTVAVDSFLKGVGVGRRLVEGLLDRLRALGTGCVVLECLTSRQRFYEACGFRTVIEFADPGGPDLYSVLMRLDLSAPSHCAAPVATDL
jgi:GNAT superfamily N-acetyltransferase